MPPRTHPEPGAGLLVVGQVARRHVRELCERLALLVDEDDPEVVICDIVDLVADVVAVHALACLQLTARRLGCSVRLRGASRELRQLLDLCGLTDLLGGEPLALG